MKKVYQCFVIKLCREFVFFLNYSPGLGGTVSPVPPGPGEAPVVGAEVGPTVAAVVGAVVAAVEGTVAVVVGTVAAVVEPGAVDVPVVEEGPIVAAVEEAGGAEEDPGELPPVVGEAVAEEEGTGPTVWVAPEELLVPAEDSGVKCSMVPTMSPWLFVSYTRIIFPAESVS